MSGSWSVVNLTELIVSLSDPDEAIDLELCLARLAESLDAEAATIIRDRSIVASWGFGKRGPAGDRTLAAIDAADKTSDIPGLGLAHVAAARSDKSDDRLVVMRINESFTADEMAFIRAISRVLSLALSMRSSLDSERDARSDLQRRVTDNRRLVTQLRERQGLLDRLFRIQQSISHRAPTKDVLDAITVGARDLLHVSRVGLRLLDADSGDLLLVSTQGVNGPASDGSSAPDIVTTEDPVAGRAFHENRVVISSADVKSNDPVVINGVAMAAPVHINGEPVGSLVVSSKPDRRFSPPEQEALLAFAEHASLALQDARAIDAMRNALQRERHRAEHDPLTSLPNRVTVQHRLDELLVVARDHPVSVLFVDLDRFKLINDTLGHSFGDEVLKVVAARLRTSVRDGDIVGRLSGDEFVVICDQMSHFGAIELSDRIQDALAVPIERGDGDHTITASVGIATATDGDTAEALIANADLAMYRAKQNGRSRVELFDQELRKILEERLAVGQDLRRALDADEMCVYLQPIVDLPSRRVVGFEALARWEHPERGLVLPEDFIGLAEEVGLIQQVDRKILVEVISLISRHRCVRPVAANVSARTFADPSLVTWLRSRFSDHNVDPSLLRLEVTETALMEQTGTTMSQLDDLRKLGVKVLIDDFGTGYSSLAYLQTFAVDGVKIDRSFTARLGSDRRADAIVAAVFHMASALDLLVVAEGVESDDQVQRLSEIRNRSGEAGLLAQGFMFGIPQPGDMRLEGFVELVPYQ